MVDAQLGLRAGVTPLAVRMRPRSLDEVAGQRHLLTPGSPLVSLASDKSGEQGSVSVILWGPPGTGKTTLARKLHGPLMKACGTPFCLLDKDTLYGGYSAAAMAMLTGDPNDRDSPLFLEHLRDPEYRGLLDTACDNLELGVSALVVGPLSREVRERRLFDAGITARQDLEAAEAARAEAEAELGRAQAAVQAAGVTGNGRYLAVTSPIAGRITEVDTQLGAYVAAGAELFNVADPRRIQIEASVPSGDAQRIRQGDRAIVELPDGGTVEAVVRSATPALDRESRTATVVLQPAGVPAGLAQGQALRVRIVPRGGAARGIVVPEEAVQQVEGRDVVFVQAEGGFQAVPVSVGQRGGGRAEILEGLRPGLVVVTRGAFVLKSQLGASEAEH